MVTLQPPVITGAKYLMEFAAPVRRIRFEAARAEEAFADIFNVQSVQTNAPDDADPQTARIVFARGAAKKQSIQISQAHCQLELNFEGAGLSPAKTLETIEKHVSQFHGRAVSRFPVAPYELTALILNIEVKCADAKQGSEELNSHLFEQFFKIPAIGDVASAQATLGFRIDEHFINLAAAVSETRTVEFPAGPPAAPELFVKIKDMKVIGRALTFQVDVNNRPTAESAGYIVPQTPDKVFTLTRDFLRNGFSEVTGIGIL